MTKLFENALGDRFVLLGPLQSLTEPIYIPIEYRVGVGYDYVGDLGVEDVIASPYSTLEEAVASHEWMTLAITAHQIEQRDARLAEYDSLPYAILEIHPDRGARLHSIVPDGDGYRADIHEPECALDVAEALLLMVEVD